MEESRRNKELIETVSRQNSELIRYKTRLKDLVNAHKCLLKEKEVLDSSLKALSKLSTAPNDIDVKLETEDSASEEITTEGNHETNEKLKSQLSTLMNSLATLSEEKSRMEAGFQADKKQLRAEKIDLDKIIKEMQGRLDHETRAHLSEMENFKSKLIIERHQREKEHNDHGVMIRELQKVVSEERAKRERAEANLELVRSELSSTIEQSNNSKKEANEAISNLEALRERLKDNRESTGATTLKLKHELALLRQQLRQSTQNEQDKLKEAETRSRELATAHEERVANLEAKLAELSHSVGNYDRLRQTDQEAITRLRERIAQLEMERGEEKGDDSIDSLVYRIRKIIQDANKISEKPLDLKGILMELLPDSNVFKETHKQCQDEYDQLKEEFYQYKHKFQLSLHMDSNSYRTTLVNEEELLSQIKKLKTRIRELLIQIDEKESLRKQEIEALQKSVLNEKKIAKEKINQVEIEWRGKLSNLEMQLAKQRQRALSLVAERENELTQLKESLIPSSISSDMGGEEGPIVLHYSEEVARRDVELSRLRKEKHRYETMLRESDRTNTQLTARVETLSQTLHCQVDRFVQCQSREGANLEYLKNVVLSFLLTSDVASKSHMLNAIAAVLKFSETEKTKILQLSWWQKVPS